MSLEHVRTLKAAAEKKKAKGPQPKWKKRNKYQRSKKQRKTNAALSAAYGPYLEQHPFCVIRSPECTHVATCVNHKKGRGKNEVLDQNTWEPSCSACNFYIEGHHQWAVDNGHKISRHIKSQDYVQIQTDSEPGNDDMAAGEQQRLLCTGTCGQVRIQLSTDVCPPGSARSPGEEGSPGERDQTTTGGTAEAGIRSATS